MSTENTTQTVYVRPRRSWLDIDLRELWAYRELLYFLTWRDLKIRYKQTAIGIFWVVLQPVLTTVIFAIVFSQVGRFNTPDLPYPLYVLSGLLIWLFTNNAIIFASNSLVGSSDLVTKIYFPRVLMPLAAVLAGLIDLGIGLGVLLAAMVIYGVFPSSRIWMVPVFILLAVVLTLFVGIFFSALNVRFRDVKFALPFFLQVWMFASPVFYPLEILSDKARFAMAFNPLTGVLAGMRSALFGQPPEWTTIGISVASIVVVAVIAIIVFSRMEDDFADMI